jgi:hypothetical protein
MTNFEKIKLALSMACADLESASSRLQQEGLPHCSIDVALQITLKKMDTIDDEKKYLSKASASFKTVGIKMPHGCRSHFSV